MNMRILVIDDDPDIRGMLSASFGLGGVPLGAELTYADTDAEALRLLHSDRLFDVALVGVDGERVSGMQLFKRLMERSLRIPRIALTNGRDLSRLRRAMADGASDFMVKPPAAEDLFATVTRVLEKVERRRRSWSDKAAYSALRREVDLAAEMQRRILPVGFPTRPQLDLHAAMRPARGIGGDFYDIFEIDDTRLGFLVADVSGKGIPAAFYMAIASTALRTAAMSGADPACCLNEVNEFMVARNIPGMFVSVFYGVLDTASWSLNCANGGHPPPLMTVTSGAPPRRISCDGGPVVGIVPGAVYGASQFELGPGSTVVLYTDGVTEAHDNARNAFGEAALSQLLTGVNGSSARQIIDSIEAGVTGFVAGAEQHDDMTALALRRVAH